MSTNVEINIAGEIFLPPMLVFLDINKQIGYFIFDKGNKDKIYVCCNN